MKGGGALRCMKPGNLRAVGPLGSPTVPTVATEATVGTVDPMLCDPLLFKGTADQR